MFERLTSTILQRALQEYFVLDNSNNNNSGNGAANSSSSSNTHNVMDVWSGFVRWNQMELRTAWLNEKIQSKGLPLQVIHGHVNLLTISIPWSKLNLLNNRNNKKNTRHNGGNNSNNKNSNGDAGTIVVVLDGVQLLVRTQYEFDDDALDQARIKSRRKRLQQSTESSKTATASSSWRETLRQHLKEGLLPQLADNLHLHIRDLHIRLEDIQSSPQRPMAVGLVLESLHLQHVANNNNNNNNHARQNNNTTNRQDPTWVTKESQVNHFAIYANALEDPFVASSSSFADIQSLSSSSSPAATASSTRWSEKSILQHCTQRDVLVEVLDRSIPRRANSLEATTRLAPQHTYILSPVDVTAHLQSGTDPALLVSQNRPVLEVSVHVPLVRLALQDVHVHAGLALAARFQDHKYRARYRPFRPRVAVADDPLAWWRYATHAILMELQQSRLYFSWQRFQKGYSVRKRYCDLYERKLWTEMAIDTGKNANNGKSATRQPLTAEEAAELQAMEDDGNVAVEDIVLYRAIVQMRIGEAAILAARRKNATRKKSSLLTTTSWVQRTLLGMVEDDSAASDEFQRAVDLWEEAKQNIGPPLEESTSWVAVSLQFTVDEGILAAYTPLASTIDQAPSKRLQMLFLRFVYGGFHAHGRLLGDFESLRLDTTLQDFCAEEERSDRLRHTVIAREVGEANNFLPEASPTPFLKFQFLKNSKQTSDFHLGVNAEIQQLVVRLEPSCEWIKNGRSLIRPLPKFSKLKEFWDDVGMNFINARKSQGREIFAKAETAVADHKSIDVDIWIQCPVLRIYGANESESLVIDCGQTRIRTERLAGVAKSKLIGTLRDEAVRLSAMHESNGHAENSIDMMRSNPGVNDSIRSGQFNDVMDGIQVLRDDMTALDHLAQTPGDVMTGGIESFFYDIYIIDFKTGCIWIENDNERCDMMEPILLRSTLQRSIIPRDATLFRYKMLYSVEDVSLSLSEENIINVRDILLKWNSVIHASRKDGKESLDMSVHYGSVGLFLHKTVETKFSNATNVTPEQTSDFDEDEFFDTMEHESAFTDLENAIVDENFMAESDSVLDSDSHSLARSVRSRSRRKRQASVSDVSSISEGSVSKRKVGPNDIPYLDAENLARLEENADEDAGDELDETGEIDEESFKSAVSASQVLGLISNLEEDIRDTKSALLRLQEKLSEFRAPESAGLRGDAAQRSKLKNALQLETERIRAELMAMTATRDDLKARVGAVSVSGMSVSKETNRSVEMASMLLQTRRKRGSLGVEQSLANTGSRRTIQLSGTIDCVTIRFSSTPEYEESRRGFFWARLVNSSLVYISNTNEKKIFLSNESLSSGINDGGMDNSHQVFVGGNIDYYNSELLSARFPHLIPMPSVDEKLLRVAVTIAKTKTVSPLKAPSQLFRVRIAIGDFQIAPRPYYFKEMQMFLSRVNSYQSVENVEQEKSDLDRRNRSGSKPRYFDLLATLGSFKLLDGDRELIAAVANDVTLRASGAATSELYKERVQVDLRWGSLQIFYLGQREMNQPIEVLGKRDIYSPLMRVRVRAQKAVLGEEPGWVIGRAHQRKLIDQSDVEGVEYTRNIHASVQFETINTTLLPEVIDAVAVIRDSWKIRNSLSAKEGDVDLPRKSIPRIRIDTLFRKVSIFMATNANEISEGEIASRKVVLNFGFVSSLQVDSNRDVNVRAKLEEISLKFADEKSFLVSPFNLTVLVDRTSHERTLAHQTSPIMRPPESFVWVCEQYPLNCPDFPKVDESINVSITFLVTSCDLNINPKNCSFVAALARRLKDCFEIGKQKQPSHDSEGSGNRSSNFLLRANFDRIRVSFFEQGQSTLPRSSGPQFLLGTEALMCVCYKSDTRSRIWTRIWEVETIDFSLRRGIQSLGRSAFHAKRVAVRDGTKAMLETEATFNRDDTECTLDLNVRLSSFQILLLPSLVRSALAFQRVFSSSLADLSSNPKEVNRPKQSWLGISTDMTISVVLDSLEILAPTRDITRSIRDGEAGDMGVVSVRCGLELRSSFVINDVGQMLDLDYTKKISVEDVKASLEDFVARRMEQNKNGLVVNTSNEILVHDFQILRTMIRVPSTNPIAFDTTGSSSREQRVTNSFSVAFRHELAATAIDHELGGANTATKVSVSQAFEIKSEFVDVLLYIARSDRGVNTAIDASIRPILNLIQGRKKAKVPEKEKSDELPGIIHILARSTTVASFRVEGVQVTCVPGGATRLTESPIIKFTLFRITAGCGLAGQAAPPGIRLTTSSTSLDGIHSDSTREYRHLVAGAWLSCEISAYYHNRRLVEWEPFIEPWFFVVRLGTDIMRILRLPAVPIEIEMPTELETESKPTEQSLSSTVTRLASLSRLLRSPFGANDDSAGILAKSGPFITDTDVCALLLQSKDPDILKSAIFRTPGASYTIGLPPLPGEDMIEWMRTFGYPVLVENTPARVDPALVFSLTDEGTLDVNVTGAMIDTLWQYLSKKQDRDTAPHLIQNQSGLTLRFQEVLDQDRSAAGERAPKVTLESGKSAPLSLRRSLSQSCDPHKAYISVELGTFDETIGRLGPETKRPAKGSRSSVFSYRILSKIPVDTVGTSRYPLEWSGEKSSRHFEKRSAASLGFIIVKVRLEGGVKIVSVESPLSLSNTADLDILFEMRENDGVSVLWRSYLEHNVPGLSSPVPADLAVSHYTKNCKLFLVSVPQNFSDHMKDALSMTEEDCVDQLKIPPTFSQTSLSRGILSETDLSIREPGSQFSRHLNACSLRVGTISLDQQGKVPREIKESTEIPEQRVLLFRSSLLFRSHLALPIELQIRNLSPDKPMVLQNRTITDEEVSESNWEYLGRLDCGAFLSWSGAAPYENLQVRFRFVEEKGGPHRQFPHWSTPTNIPADGQFFMNKNTTRKASSYIRSNLQGMEVFDSEARRLLVSLCLTKGSTLLENGEAQSIDYYLNNLHNSGRAISLFAPYWVIDQTGLNLQFRSGGVIAGQEKSHFINNGAHPVEETMGLGELLDDRNLSHLPSRIPYRIHMIGDRSSSFINIKMGKSRQCATYDSSWSTPVYLSRKTKDTVVVAPGKTSLDMLTPEESGRESFVVRSRLIDAPEQYGGIFGTKLLHVVCKYVVVNDLGQDIEILSGLGAEENALVVKSDNRPRPLSFISGRMRFRPKEHGWYWSGRFSVTLSRKDVTLRLRHGLKGYSMIADVEFHPGETTGTSVIVFKKAGHAPYRIENHSMFPLTYCQRSPFSQTALSKGASSREDCVVLPYHSAAFAWDEPEALWRSVGIQFADFGMLPSDMSKEYLGSFDLDHLSPGTEVQLPGEGGLIAKVIADGPTRVLRITGVSSGETFTQSSPTKHRSREANTRFLSVSAQIRLRNGIGVSVVDWTPQELLYIDLQDIAGDLEVDKGKETSNLSIGFAAINNQLWVTPYPVAVSIGSRTTRRRHRRTRALRLSWVRSLSGNDSFEGVTILGKFEVLLEPIDIRIDGRLAALMVDMVKQLKRMIAAQVATGKRDKTNGGRFDSDFLSPDDGLPDLADELYSSLEFMATNTIAAKLRHNYRPIHLIGRENSRKPTNAPGLPFLKSKHKFYVGRMRVSLTSLTLSWHGFLPVSSVIRPAFFFEGLPIFMRPYVSSHVYGSMRDLAKGVLSHYVSVRRIIDVGVGAMVRKPFFFPREIVTYILSSTAGTLQVAERSLLAVAHASAESSSRNGLYERLSLPLTTFSAALLRAWANVLRAGSSIVRYGSVSPRPTGAQLRSRNPRFFAHTDGNDLLVEYVEGENAGKALLSRVRMGAHLIEGYSSHVEDVFESRTVGGNFQMDGKPLILMTTHSRLMLLRGQLDDNFCNVAWEVTFDDIAHVECTRLDDGPSSYDLFTLWYLRELHGQDDSEDTIARTAVVGSSGLGLLHPMNLFVPRASSRLLIENLSKALS